MIPTEATAIDPRNGMTDDYIGMAGYMVFLTCHDVKPDWENADKLTWTMTAKNVVQLIDQARATEKDVPVNHLAAMIHQWSYPTSSSPFFELPNDEKLAWEAVARFWGSALRAENHDHVGDVAKAAVEWYKKKVFPPPHSQLAKPNDLTGNVYPPPMNGNGKHSVVPAVPREHFLTGMTVGKPTPLELTPGAGRGMSRSFGRLIDMKIDEYARKIMSLQALKDRIGLDCDEALYEIIAPLLKEGD